PLLSIVDATLEEARRLGFSRVGLFGTSFTMEGRFYPDVFTAGGIALIAPAPEERAYIHGKYMSELLRSQFLPETRQRLVDIAARMKERDGIEAVILAGTELPLLLRDAEEVVVPFLDTTHIHAQAVVRKLIA